MYLARYESFNRKKMANHEARRLTVVHRGNLGLACITQRKMKSNERHVGYFEFYSSSSCAWTYLFSSVTGGHINGDKYGTEVQYVFFFIFFFGALELGSGINIDIPRGRMLCSGHAVAYFVRTALPMNIVKSRFPLRDTA